MDDERLVLIGAAGALAALLGWYVLAGRDPNATRGGRPARPIGASGIYGAGLDITGGMVTPEHLLWSGPGGPLPPYWVPHRHRYPLAPGTELCRLIYGAPMAANTVTRWPDRGWLFAPPAEDDL